MCLPDFPVIVLADRGLYAPWLFKHVVALGWHPFLRLNRGGQVRPVGSSTFVWLSSLVPTTGTAWCGVVDCFVEHTGPRSPPSLLAGGLRGPVADPDRLDPGVSQCGLVAHAQLD